MTSILKKYKEIGGSALHYNPFCRQTWWVGGKSGVLEAIVQLYYSKQLTVPVLGCFFIEGRGQRTDTEEDTRREAVREGRRTGGQGDSC